MMILCGSAQIKQMALLVSLLCGSAGKGSRAHISQIGGWTVEGD